MRRAAFIVRSSPGPRHPWPLSLSRSGAAATAKTASGCGTDPRPTRHLSAARPNSYLRHQSPLSGPVRRAAGSRLHAPSSPRPDPAAPATRGRPSAPRPISTCDTRRQVAAQGNKPAATRRGTSTHHVNSLRYRIVHHRAEEKIAIDFLARRARAPVLGAAGLGRAKHPRTCRHLRFPTRGGVSSVSGRSLPHRPTRARRVRRGGSHPLNPPTSGRARRCRRIVVTDLAGTADTGAAGRGSRTGTVPGCRRRDGRDGRHRRTRGASSRESGPACRPAGRGSPSPRRRSARRTDPIGGADEGLEPVPDLVVHGLPVEIARPAA